MNEQQPQDIPAQQRLRECEERIVRLQDEVLRLRQERIADPETTLYSTTYFHNRLSEEIVRSERYRHFLSLMLIHVELTDAMSTQQVTREIRRIGLTLKTGLTRRSDLLALYGRRQIVVMLPETDTRGTGILLQRFQSMFPNNGRRLAYSILTYPLDASNMELVLSRLQELSEDLFRRGGRGLSELNR